MIFPRRSFSKRRPIKYYSIEKVSTEVMDLRRGWHETLLKKETTKEVKEEMRLLLKLNKGRKRYLVASYKGIKVAAPVQGNRLELYRALKAHLLAQLKLRRINVKTTKSYIREIEGEPLFLHGGVHTEKNSILNMYGLISKKRVNTYRKPENNENHVGVELEFVCQTDREPIAEALITEKLSRWTRIKTDGSLKDDDGKSVNNGNGTFGWEVCVVSPESKVDDLVGRTCKVLNSFAARANTSCGLHVHLDMRNRNKELVYHNLVQCQDLLLAMVKPTRRGYTYCTSQTTVEWEKANRHHYAGISTSSYEQHKTIEVRFHHGSVNFDEIKAWITLLTKIANFNEKLPNKVQSIMAVNKFLKLEESFLSNLEKRGKEWAA